MSEAKKLIGTIDLTPTWRSLVQTYVAFIRDGTTKEQDMAYQELCRMAEIADFYVANRKVER